MRTGLFVLLLAGCGGDDAGEHWAGTVDTLPNGAVRVSNPATGVWAEGFGTMTRGMDQGYFLLKGLRKVRGEFSLTTLSYNLKRVLNIVGVPRRLEVLAGLSAG